MYKIFGRNGALTKFSTSQQFKNSNPTVEWRFEHLGGFLFFLVVRWPVATNDRLAHLVGKVRNINFRGEWFPPPREMHCARHKAMWDCHATRFRELLVAGSEFEGTHTYPLKLWAPGASRPVSYFLHPVCWTRSRGPIWAPIRGASR
jgi:hypothetical protein